MQVFKPIVVLRLVVVLVGSTAPLSSYAGDGVRVHFEDDGATQLAEMECYPAWVSHDPGHPGKPRREKPGDINRSDCPPERYCISDCERAGNPHEVAWWARCVINKNYSAWFVGGGNPWVFPGKSRCRTREEGTWGLDYDGLFRPRRVWLSWSQGREQAGLGAYETDGKLPLASLRSHHE